MRRAPSASHSRYLHTEIWGAPAYLTHLPPKMAHSSVDQYTGASCDNFTAAASGDLRPRAGDWAREDFLRPDAISPRAAGTPRARASYCSEGTLLLSCEFWCLIKIYKCCPGRPAGARVSVKVRGHLVAADWFVC